MADPAPPEPLPVPKIRTARAAEEVFVRAATSEELDATADPSSVAEVDPALDARKYIGCSHIREYALKEKLGEGTFGIVWKGIRGGGERKTNGKEIALTVQMREDEERQEEEELVKRGLRVRKGDVVALKQIIFHSEGDGVRLSPPSVSPLQTSPAVRVGLFADTLCSCRCRSLRSARFES